MTKSVTYDIPDLALADDGGGNDMNPGMVDLCGDQVSDPACLGPVFGPPDAPFPLSTDQNKTPGESDNGVNRDGNGWLGLDSTHPGQGSYAMVVPGCIDPRNGLPMDTQWYQVAWDADVPPNTSLIVHAKTGKAPNLNDPSWMANSFTTDTSQSPLWLLDGLVPNWGQSNPPYNDWYLYIEFMLKTQSQSATPKLKGFSVGYKCGWGNP